MTEVAENPRAVIGGNSPPIYDAMKAEIEDLFDEAKIWADGIPIDSEEMHDSISKLRDMIHDAGKRADEARVEEKKPHDDAVKAIQAKWNPLIQKDKGKVDLAKSALADLLAAWRKRVADEKAAEAKRRQEEAEAARVAAIEAIQASSGNLEARIEAEEVLAHAKSLEKDANRATKAATTGTGLRTVWVATLTDEAAALDWAYGRAPDEFRALVQGMAETVVRAGMRSVPGFVVTETKVV